MSSATVHTAFRTWIEANWQTTPLRFENESLDPPADGSPFVMVELEGGLFDQISIGGGQPTDNLWREDGTVFLHVMVASGNKAATLQGLQYREDLANLMRGLQLAPKITFRALTFGPGEKVAGDGNYFRLPLTADFFRDQ